MSRLFKVFTLGVFIMASTLLSATEHEANHKEDNDTIKENEAWDPVPVVMDQVGMVGLVGGWPQPEVEVNMVRWRFYRLVANRPAWFATITFRNQ